MAERGLSPRVVFAGPLEPDGYQASLQLLTGADRPTAIFAGHDTLAIGALRARMELGLTVDDVSVVGYGNIDLAAHPLNLTPPLTSSDADLARKLRNYS